MQESYCDVTIACDGKFYPVHKLVLSVCSDYFEQMFDRTKCKHPIIVLKDIRHEDLEALLNYMYVGEVNVLQSDLSGLIKAAECLRIKGLAVPDEEPTPQESKRSIPWAGEAPEAKRRRAEEGASQRLSSSQSPGDKGGRETSTNRNPTGYREPFRAPVRNPREVPHRTPSSPSPLNVPTSPEGPLTSAVPETGAEALHPPGATHDPGPNAQSDTTTGQAPAIISNELTITTDHDVS